MFKLLVVLLIVSSTFAVPKRIRRNVQDGRIEPRIIGGELARAGQYPFAAAIFITTPSGNYFCGGSLISLEWLITAGQCVDGATLFTIILGTTDLSDTGSNVVKVATEHYVLYPDYNPNTLEHDIGLIKLRQKVEWTYYVKGVIGLADVTASSFISLGWGQTSDSDSQRSDHLYYVELTALSNEECKAFYGSQIVEGMVCVIGNYNEGTCIGDSGSPLIEDFYGNHYHVGVSSFVSANGCESTLPSGFTRTRSYCEWVKNTTATHTNSCY